MSKNKGATKIFIISSVVILAAGLAYWQKDNLMKLFKKKTKGQGEEKTDETKQDQSNKTGEPAVAKAAPASSVSLKPKMAISKKGNLVYTLPSTDSDVVTAAPAKKQMSISSEQGNWYAVNLKIGDNSYFGWVLKTLVDTY